MGDPERRKRDRGSRSRNADKSGEEKRTTLGGGVVPIAGGGGIFKSAAVAVLRQERKLMTTGDITRIAVEQGLLKCSGKTPEATMASALYTDVKRKLQKSVFTRPQEGLFGLREWIEEGYFPEGWVGPPDGLGLAPFKRRNSGGNNPPTATTRNRAAAGRPAKPRAPRAAWKAEEASEGDDNVVDEEEEEEVAGEEEGEEEEQEQEQEEGEEADAMDDDGEELEAAAHERQAGREASPASKAHLNHHYAHHHMHSHAAVSNTTAANGSNTASGTRRSSRLRPSIDSDGTPQDDCMSPLHMLGEAAASESMDIGGEQDAPPPSKRRRPSNISVPVIDRSGGGVDSMTPKSPFQDSLAALHEIATSPSMFGSHGLLDAGGPHAHREGSAASGPGGGHGGGRSRPQLVVDVLGGNSQDSQRGGLPSLGMGTPSSLLHDMAMLQHAGSGSGLLLQSLETPTLVQLQLPDGQDPDGMLNGMPAGMHGTMMGPSGQLLPRPGMKTSKAEAVIAAARARRVSFSGTVGILGPPSQPQPLLPPLQRQAPHSWPPKMTQQQAENELAEIGRVQAVVERLEAKLGSSHPQVGKAWLALARMYQHVGAAGHGGMDRAADALKRAWAVCRGCAESCGVAVHCEGAFGYLAAAAATVPGGGTSVEAAAMAAAADEGGKAALTQQA